MGWEIDENDFKSVTYFQFDTVSKTVELHTTLPFNVFGDLVNLTALGYDCDYHKTLEDLAIIEKLPIGFLRPYLTWLELSLYSNLDDLADDYLTFKPTKG